LSVSRLRGRSTALMRTAVSITIRRSETDQEDSAGDDRLPGSRLKAWLEAAAITEGRCFGRSPRAAA
jgi:hypothetical protein